MAPAGTRPRRAALGIFADGQGLPLEFFGRTTGDGFPSAVHLVGRREFDDPNAGPGDLDRVRAALASVGGGAVSDSWRFPRAAARTGNIGRSAARRLAPAAGRRVVARGRVGRGTPVLATRDRGDARGGRRQRAARRGDSTGRAQGDRAGRRGRTQGLPRRTGLAGAEGLRRAACRSLGPDYAQHGRLRAAAGGSLADLSAGGRGLLTTGYEAPTDTLGFQLLFDRSGTASRQRDDFLVGLAVGELAAPLPAALAAPTWPSCIASHAACGICRTLSPGGPKQLAADARWLAEVGGLVGELDRGVAGELLFQLAQGYHQQGRWDLASETFSLLATSYADHPLAGPALVWLIQQRAAPRAANLRPRPAPGRDSANGRWRHVWRVAFHDCVAGRTAAGERDHVAGRQSPATVPAAHQLDRSIGPCAARVGCLADDSLRTCGRRRDASGERQRDPTKR